MEEVVAIACMEEEEDDDDEEEGDPGDAVNDEAGSRVRVVMGANAVKALIK